MEIYYKVLNEDGRPYHGGTGTWSLPHDGQPGEWMPALAGKLIPCEHAYHACRGEDLLSWLGPHIYTVEFRGEVVAETDKVYGREARLLARFDTWNPRTQRLFAADCAERALPLYEARHPNDHTVRDCINVARRYARGEATLAELDAASAAAAYAAYASSADERQWQTARLMQYLRGEA